MALIPENFTEVFATAEEDAEDVAPSKTWAIDFEKGRIGGFIDEDKALQQFVIKALLTERSRFVIYTDDYGNELLSLIGEDITPALLDAEIPRMVEEALIYDDRIESVEDINYTREGDKLFISARIVATNGQEIELDEEVAVNGI